MRTTLLLLLAFAFHPALSQGWEEIEIDNKVRITVPKDYNWTVTRDKIEISAVTASGSLLIDRYDLPDSLYNKGIKLDNLDPYVKGFIMGMQNAKKIEKVKYNNEIFIQDVRAREVLLSNKDDRVVQIYFFIIDQKMYTIQFSEKEKPSEEDRKVLFSSIRIQ